MVKQGELKKKDGKTMHFIATSEFQNLMFRLIESA